MKIYFTKHVVRVLIFSVLSLSLFAQSIKAQTITGKITDEKGEPLLGTTVVLKSSTTGTVANIKEVAIPDINHFLCEPRLSVNCERIFAS
jgi:hypothetical protein